MNRHLKPDAEIRQIFRRNDVSLFVKVRHKKLMCFRLQLAKKVRTRRRNFF